VLVEFDHVRLRGESGKPVREMAAVPRVGDSVGLWTSKWVVSAVHWFEPPVAEGRPVAVVSLVSRDEWAARG
jgi:hypothetical protein